MTPVRSGWLLAAVLVAGCQQMPLGRVQPPLQGKFIDSPAAKPLQLEAVNDSLLLNNPLVDYLAPASDTSEVRGFGKLDLGQQMDQVDSFQAPRMQAYCEEVLRRLLAQWPYPDKPDIKVRFSAAEGFGARATADNVIYLNLGTLQAIESEDELAAVLGHEASHLLLGHMDRQNFFNQQKKLIDAGINAVNLGVTLADLESQKSGDTRKLVLGNPDAVGKAIVKSSATGTILQAFSDNLWNSSWTRGQEDQADLLSVDLLSRAGYSPRGSVFSMQRLQSYEGERQSLLERYRAQQPALFSTALQKKGLNGVIEQGMQSGLNAAQYLAVDLWQSVGKRHHSSAEREAALSRYIAAEYRSERRRGMRNTEYQEHLLAKGSGAMLAGQVQINRATRALQEGDLATARSLAREVARSPAGNSLRGRTLQFLLELRQGHSKQALAQLEQVPESEWQYASLASYDQVISLSLSLGRQAQAERYLARGRQHWGEPMMMPMAIMVDLHGKRVAQAQERFQACQQSRNKGLMAQCESAIGQHKPEQQADALEQLGLPKLGTLFGS